MMLPFFAAAADAVSQAPTLAVASASFLLSAAQWFNSSRKGRSRDTRLGATQAAHDEKLGRIEANVDRIETKVDHALEQHATLSLEIVGEFADQGKRIDAVSSHVIGPDGKNGLRSRVEALERRVGPPDRRAHGDEP